MIEGTLLFSAAAVRKLESAEPGQLVYPFCVRQAGVGYASASLADENDARAEMWMPLWSNPATLAELTAIFSEGRAQVAGRPARNGVDFTRAVVTLVLTAASARSNATVFKCATALLFRHAVGTRGGRAQHARRFARRHRCLARSLSFEGRTGSNAPASVTRALRQSRSGFSIFAKMIAPKTYRRSSSRSARASGRWRAASVGRRKMRCRRFLASHRAGCARPTRARRNFVSRLCSLQPGTRIPEDTSATRASRTGRDQGWRGKALGRMA